MIYFLVNNNYHMIDTYEHCVNLKDYEKSLIQVPHTLECIDENENFRNIYTFKSLLNGVKSLFHFFKIKKIEQQIKLDLQINKFDILFVYTEYEVLNQYIMYVFKNAGAKVFVLNEGLATYVTYCTRNENKFTLKEKGQLIYFKYILKYKFVKFLKYNNMIFPQINESFIDGVLLYLDVKIDRNIQKYVIEKSSNFLTLNKNKAIFLNEKMYDHYCSITEHIAMLKDCLQNLSNKFEIVYFKFHPREIEENRKWQMDVINKFQNVQIIQENDPIENLLIKYDAKYVYSFLSAALLNVNSMGAIPVYVYHLYNEISHNNIFKQIDIILEKAGYTFIDKNYENIKNVGFLTVEKEKIKMLDFIKSEIQYE